jgi:hypothetical protein
MVYDASAFRGLRAAIAALPWIPPYGTPMRRPDDPLSVPTHPEQHGMALGDGGVFLIDPPLYIPVYTSGWEIDPG